jgi:hypothetical protein
MGLDKIYSEAVKLSRSGCNQEDKRATTIARKEGMRDAGITA